MSRGRNCCKCVTVSLVPTASLTLVILFACGIILLPTLYIELSHEYKFGIIIDAGSSHTTLYAYRWRIPTVNHSTGAIEVSEIYKCPRDTEKSAPSLNSFATHPSDAGSAILNCLTHSKNELPIEEDKDRAYVPLYLGATAGMRILNMTNKSVSDQILESVRKTLGSTEYQFKNKDAKIISGEQEAVGGWITANYLEHNLKPPSDKVETVGALDLGGASAEIAFEVSPDTSTFTTSKELFSREYDVYARSYLCYGQNEAYSRFLAYLHSKAAKNTSIENPCIPTGANVTYHHSSIYTGCVNPNSAAAMEAFGFGLAPPTSLGTDYSINFIGKWNSTQCHDDIATVFNFDKCWPSGICKSGDFKQPDVNGKFVGFSAFYYTANFFNQTVGKVFNSTSTWDPFYNQVDKSCSTTVKGICGGHRDPKRCDQHCFNGLFMLYLLEDGFGFNKNNTSWNVTFEEKIQDISVGWALGYMLSESNTIPQDNFVELRPYTAVDLVVGIIILSILCVVFVIFFFLTFYACRKALRPRNGFQPI